MTSNRTFSRARRFSRSSIDATVFLQAPSPSRQPHRAPRSGGERVTLERRRCRTSGTFVARSIAVSVVPVASLLLTGRNHARRHDGMGYGR